MTTQNEHERYQALARSLPDSRQIQVIYANDKANRSARYATLGKLLKTRVNINQQFQWAYYKMRQWAVSVTDHCLNNRSRMDPELFAGLQKTAVNMCACRPPGNWVIVHPDGSGNYPWISNQGRTIKFFCRNNKFCPWCFYREYLNLYEELCNDRGPIFYSLVYFNYLTTDMDNLKRQMQRKARRSKKVKNAYVITQPAFEMERVENHVCAKLLCISTGDSVLPAKLQDVGVVEVNENVNKREFLDSYLHELFYYPTEILDGENVEANYIRMYNLFFNKRFILKVDKDEL